MIKSTIISFAIMTVTFLFIDVIWLSQAVGYFYQPNIGHLLNETPFLIPAILFYLIYPLGVAILIIVPSLNEKFLRISFFRGFVFGFVAYGTYNLTNMATIKGWSVNVVIVDMFWGGLLTGVSATLSTYIVRNMNRNRR